MRRGGEAERWGSREVGRWGSGEVGRLSKGVITHAGYPVMLGGMAGNIIVNIIVVPSDDLKWMMRDDVLRNERSRMGIWIWRFKSPKGNWYFIE